MGSCMELVWQAVVEETSGEWWCRCLTFLREGQYRIQEMHCFHLELT